MMFVMNVKKKMRVYFGAWGAGVFWASGSGCGAGGGWGFSWYCWIGCFFFKNIFGII